jgi:uncharacterized protein (TIGR02118 family)
MTARVATDDTSSAPNEQLLPRRQLLKTLSLGALAASTASLDSVSCALAAQSPGTGKVVFVLFRRPDLTHEQSLAEWKGQAHVALVRKIPGLQKWTQNHPSSVPGPGMADGIGELWFVDAQSLSKAMSSPEMAAAGEDAKRFLDMEKTYAALVSEHTILG